MTFTDSYLTENGYDYFGNAAEDTLVFFVRDEDAPYVEPSVGNNHEDIINLSDDTVNGMSASPSAGESAANTETHAEIYKANRGDNSRNFDIEQNSEAGENEYKDNPVAGSMAVPDANTDDDEFSQPMPQMAQKDMKQTEVGPSNRENGMNN